MSRDGRTERVVRNLWLTYKVDRVVRGKTRLVNERAPKGAKIMVLPDDEKRLDSLGALEPKAKPAKAKPSVDVAAMDLAELTAYLREADLAPGETVKLAGEDRQLAERLMVAESESLDGTPREWVMKRLETIAKGSSGGADDEGDDADAGGVAEE